MPDLFLGQAASEAADDHLGQSGTVRSIAVSPDERRIASSRDESISIRPMPDVTKPPLHTRPHAKLLAQPDAHTNLRVVRDPAAARGWKLDVGRFPGGKDVPTWRGRPYGSSRWNAASAVPPLR